MTANRQATDVWPRLGDVLLIVDLQRDFFPGGALPVPGVLRVLPAVNKIIRRFQDRSCPIIATRDWHPHDHCSFVTRGGKWPVHCVAGSDGAELASGLELPDNVVVVSKGTSRDGEAYSAFSQTILKDWLAEHAIRRLFLGGVATEICVLETAKDAIAAGLEVVLLGDCVSSWFAGCRTGETF